MKDAARRFLVFLLAALSALSAAAQEVADAQIPQLRVGIVAFLRPSPNEPIIEPTVKLLQKLFPLTRVSTSVMTMQELSRAIQNRSVDIFIASAGFYRQESVNGASAIAAVAHVTHPNPNSSEGSAFVVRRDLPVSSIEELKGLRLMAATPDGFTAMRVAQGELLERGYDPLTFFGSTQYSGPGEKIAEIVKSLKGGTVDVGIFRTCWIEDWMRAHPQDKYEFRVIEPKTTIGACQSSTALYPSWVIAATPHLPPTVSRTNGTVIITAFLAFLALLAHAVRTSQLVKKRTSALRDSLAREKALKRAAMQAADRIERLQRSGIIGQISSMIAHELRQPLATLSLYTKGLRRMVRPGLDPQSVLGILDQIDNQTERINSIVENVRSYAKSKTAGRSPADLREICRAAIRSWQETGRYQNVSVHFSAPESIRLTVNSLEWELVVLNLIKNAAEAQKNMDRGLVSVHLARRSDNRAELTVSDNGPEVGEQVLEALSKPLASTKAEGLGLGISIVRSILEAHGARLEFSRNTPSGLCATVSIPLP